MAAMDNALVFHDNAAITASADATNHYDAAVARALGTGDQMAIVFLVTTTFDSSGDGAELEIKFATGTATTLGTTLATSGVIAEATLAAGYKLIIPIPPGAAYKRYIGVEFAVTTENFTAGKATCWLTPMSALSLSGLVAAPDLHPVA